MSYDLTLFPREPFGPAEFWTVFRDRPFYELQANDTFARYEHPDTGTYFSFEYRGPDSGGEPVTEDDAGDADEDPGAARPRIWFNMNFFRAHVFGLEAVREVADIVAMLDCEIEDPQRDGMGKRWDADGFLSGWNAGNAFGYQALVSLYQRDDADGASAVDWNDPDDLARRLIKSDCLMAPGADIEAAWQWNYRRAEIQNRLGDDIFVPRIIWAAAGPDVTDADVPPPSPEAPLTHPIRVVIWGDETPIVLPDCATHVIVMTDPPPPRRSLAQLFGVRQPVSADDADKRHYLIAADEIRPHVALAGRTTEGDGMIIPHGPDEMPDAFRETIAAAWPTNTARERADVYHASALRNAEMIAQAVNLSTKT